MRRLAVLMTISMLMSGPLHGQGLRDVISQLFIFGDGEDPLFLSGSADPSNPFNVQVHGDHFIPSAVASNETVISFLTNAIATNIANIPISSTSGGRTFRFEGGVPVATSTSPGPILAERAPTLGRGRFLVGANVNVFNFRALRGVPLSQIQLNFSHENVDFPGCEQAFGGDCTVYGVPGFENDVIGLQLDLDVNVAATMFLLTYGLLDWVDIGVAIPVISTSISGSSQAQVTPFGPDVNHFFGGDLATPGLSATRTVGGSASGLGDVAARLKVRVSESFTVLGDARFPTGDETNMLGSGEYAVRGVGVFSADFGKFSPHANIGYLYRGGDVLNDAMLATVGFDQLLAPWAALLVDFISELQVGESGLTVPDDVTIDAPFPRAIRVSNIPDLRDDIINGAVGFKFMTRSGLTIVTNTLWPLNDGGLRPGVAWTFGLEFNF